MPTPFPPPKSQPRAGAPRGAPSIATLAFAVLCVLQLAFFDAPAAPALLELTRTGGISVLKLASIAAASGLLLLASVLLLLRSRSALWWMLLSALFGTWAVLSWPAHHVKTGLSLALMGCVLAWWQRRVDAARKA